MASQRLSPRKAVGFLRRLVPRVRPYSGQLLVALVLLVVSTAVGLVFPLVVRQLLDAAFLAANGARLNQVAVGLLVLFAFQAVINFGQSYLMAGVSERVIADLRKDLFGHLALQPPGFFSMRRVGELSSRIAADPAMIQQVLRFGVPEMMRQGLFLIGGAHPGHLDQPTPHSGDSDRDSVRYFDGVVLRSQGAQGLHQYSGHARCSDRPRRAGVHAD